MPRPSGFPAWTLLAVTLIAVLCGSTPAAIILLKSGGRFRASDVIDVGDKVEFSSSTGRVQLQKRDIVSIDGKAPEVYFRPFSPRREEEAAGSRAPTPPPAAGYWRLRARGTVWRLRASVNGTPLPEIREGIGVEGGPPFEVESRVGSLLRQGENRIDLVYERAEGATLEIVIEQIDAAGKARRRTVVEVDSGAADQGRGTVRRALRFELAPGERPETGGEGGEVTLDAAVRDAIHAVLRRYYEAHARKDLDTVLALQEKGAGQELTKMLLPPLFANEETRFAPFDPEGIELAVEGDSVVATRTGGGPIFTSNEVAVELPTSDGLTEGSIAPTRISFSRVDGRWLVKPGL